MKKIYTLALMILCSAAVFAQTLHHTIPAGKVELFDGFEHGNYWIWAGSDYDKYGNHQYSAGTALSKVWHSEGRRSLRCTIEPMTGGDGWHDGQFFYDGNQNWEGTHHVAMDIYNPNKETLYVSLIVQATDSWNWDSAEQYGITTGEHTVVFDLSQYAQDLYDIRRIVVYFGIVEAVKTDTYFYIDNIRLIK